jgi:hypothetical protein
MRRNLTFIALFVFALLCSSLVKVGHAGSISAGTYDTTGLHRDQFVGGEDVRIIADSSDMPITITVTDPDGIIVHTEIYPGYKYDEILSGLTEKSGWYTVEASSPLDTVRKNYACTYFKVIPEVPLGTIAAAMTMSLGLGFFLVQRKKRYS